LSGKPNIPKVKWDDKLDRRDGFYLCFVADRGKYVKVMHGPR
jgi:hypothetical protein